MKKRSLSRMTILTIVTLGFYGLVWLAQTREEMITKYKVKIPSIGYAILVKTSLFIGFLVGVAIILYFIPANNRAVDNFEKSRIQPSAICFGEYNTNSECRHEIDRYDAQSPDESLQLFGLFLLIIIAMGVIDWFYLSRWVVKYAEATQIVTGQRLAGTMSVLAVGGVLPFMGMLNVQDAFNKTSVE
jgi:hypothetical protein